MNRHEVSLLRPRGLPVSAAERLVVPLQPSRPCSRPAPVQPAHLLQLHVSIWPSTDV